MKFELVTVNTKNNTYDYRNKIFNSMDEIYTFLLSEIVGWTSLVIIVLPAKGE